MKVHDEILDLIRSEWLYGLEIVKRSEAQSGAVRRGTVYVHLLLLEDQGMVEKRLGRVAKFLDCDINMYQYRATKSGLTQREESCDGQRQPG